jgi:hypothetical protein
VTPTPVLALALVLAMPQPFGDLHDRAHELVIGVPGSGKTTLARARVASARRVVFATPVPRDYAEDGELVGLADLRGEPELLAGAFLRLVVPLGEDRDTHEDFADLVELLREYAPRFGGMVLVSDEVGDYSLRAAEVLTRLHRNGHHSGLASVLVSQTAVDIPLTCRRTATRVSSLLQTRSEDLAALAREYGEPFAEAVRTWRPGDPPAVWNLPTLYQTRS